MACGGPSTDVLFCSYSVLLLKTMQVHMGKERDRERKQLVRVLSDFRLSIVLPCLVLQRNTTVLLILRSCAAGAGFRLVSIAGGLRGRCSFWVVPWVIVAFLCSSWFVSGCSLFCLCCVSNRSVLMSRLCSLRVALGFLLTFLPISSFLHLVSL
jgi:hypothetical protein